MDRIAGGRGGRISGGSQSESNRPTTRRPLNGFEDRARHRPELASTAIVAGAESPETNGTFKTGTRTVEIEPDFRFASVTPFVLTAGNYTIGAYTNQNSTAMSGLTRPPSDRKAGPA
jgi:hypothetical protein